MSARSGIGYIDNDGTVKAVYCHFDGYPEYNGALLTEYYNSLDDAKSIVALGHLSSLGVRLNPIGEHSFDYGKREEGTTVAYHRDRGEALRIDTFSNAEEYMQKAVASYGAEYLYLYDGKWLCWDYDLKKIKLPNVQNNTEQAIFELA